MTNRRGFGRAPRSRPWWVARLAALSPPVAFALAALPWGAAAQWTATIRVEEPAGIRRTSFPTRARLEIPAGRLPALDLLRLEDGDGAVPVQATAGSHWPDGSVRELEIDFNVSLGPGEARLLELRYGPETLPDPAEVRGLALAEDETSVQSGRVRFGRFASPLFLSIAYRSEALGVGRNGVAVTDRDDITHDASQIDWDPVRILKPGPLVVHLAYIGTLRLASGDVPVRLDVEMPSSKSWVKLDVLVEDPDRRVGAVAIETPLAFGAHPWSWDWATPNSTYGAFRDASASMVLTQTIERPGEGSWQILAGARGEERPYEASRAGSSEVVTGAGHLVSESEAVAFAVEGIGETPGVFTAAIDGSGQTTFRFAPAEPAGLHRLTLYQHYVSTPVSIGAATSPASILKPLVVSVDP